MRVEPADETVRRVEGLEGSRGIRVGTCCFRHGPRPLERDARLGRAGRGAESAALLWQATHHARDAGELGEREEQVGGMCIFWISEMATSMSEYGRVATIQYEASTMQLTGTLQLHAHAHRIRIALLAAQPP